MKNYILAFTFMFLGISKTVAQVNIGSNATVHASAGLNISNVGDKGFLLPRVNIMDIANNQNPVANPANGLLVYNMGSDISPGVYVWLDSQWNQIADTNNIVGYLLLQRTTDYSVLAGSANDVFQNLSGTNFTVLKNDIGATYNNTTGFITLPGNSGYIINMCINIKNSQETSVSGIKPSSTTTSPINNHQYQLKLVDSSGNQYGETVSISAVSSTTSTPLGSHMLNVTFAVSLNSASSISIIPSIAHTGGGTYSLNSPSGATGAVTIENFKIDIQRAILIQ